MIKINDINNKYGLNNCNRWATVNEIKNASERIKFGDKDMKTAAGIPLLFDGENIYVDNTDSHTIIFGNTGAKKSRLLAMPLIHILAQGDESLIIADPKGELYERTSPYLNKNGYDISCINLRDIGLGQVWNPLTNMYNLYKTNKDKGMEMASDFVSLLIDNGNDKTTTVAYDNFWDSMSGQLILANLQLLFETGLKEEINIFYQYINYILLIKIYSIISHNSDFEINTLHKVMGQNYLEKSNRNSSM